MPDTPVTPFDRLFPKRRHIGLWIVVAALLVVLALGGWYVWWLTATRVIASSGGLYFLRPVAISVPAFLQGDPRWHDDPLGATTDSVGDAGCAMTSAAMVLKFYGVDTDPHRLNAYLTAHHGYEGNGYIIWEKAAKLGRDLKKAYEDSPSYWRIDHQLMKGNPVIVRLHLRPGETHFVVIAGKRGFDYLILDPAAAGGKGLYPLRELTASIDGLRYYRRKKGGKI
ncbi:MAG: C39 family peptidase [Chthoniobacteraceae bacterium]